MYQYLIRNDFCCSSPSGLTPGIDWAPCDRGKNLRPAGGFELGSKAGIVMPGTAVSYETLVVNDGASVKGSISEQRGERGDTSGV